MLYPNYETILIKYILVDPRPPSLSHPLRFAISYVHSCHVMEYIRYRDMITGHRKSESHITAKYSVIFQFIKVDAHACRTAATNNVDKNEIYDPPIGNATSALANESNSDSRGWRTARA